MLHARFAERLMRISGGRIQQRRKFAGFCPFRNTSRTIHYRIIEYFFLFQLIVIICHWVVFNLHSLLKQETTVKRKNRDAGRGPSPNASIRHIEPYNRVNGMKQFVISICLTLISLLAIGPMAPMLKAETILLENEDVIQGTITKYTMETITIETESGAQEIPIRDIHLIDYLGALKDIPMGILEPNVFTIYLKNGEVIEGTITQFSNEFMIVESAAGHGVLQLPTTSVNLITTKKSRMRMEHRNGLGYVQKKSTLNSEAGITNYGSDQLSYKMFFDDDLFGNVLLAYGNASVNGRDLQIFALDYRMGLVFDQIQNIMLYYGGSVGYLQINDDNNGVDGTGTSLGAFIGGEMTFATLPNFGFAGEIGYRIQKAGNYDASDLSLSTFPSFSIHYYF